MSSETNGNGKLMGVVLATVVGTALTTWAASGSKAYDKAVAVEAAQVGLQAQVTALKESLTELKGEMRQTKDAASSASASSQAAASSAQAVWKLLDEERRRGRRGEER